MPLPSPVAGWDGGVTSYFMSPHATMRVAPCTCRVPETSIRPIIATAPNVTCEKHFIDSPNRVTGIVSRGPSANNRVTYEKEARGHYQDEPRGFPGAASGGPKAATFNRGLVVRQDYLADFRQSLDSLFGED